MPAMPARASLEKTLWNGGYPIPALHPGRRDPQDASAASSASAPLRPPRGAARASQGASSG